jgi:hypothetical protein
MDQRLNAELEYLAPGSPHIATSGP